jgi:hypothetical protein
VTEPTAAPLLLPEPDAADRSAVLRYVADHGRDLTPQERRYIREAAAALAQLPEQAQMTPAHKAFTVAALQERAHNEAYRQKCAECEELAADRDEWKRQHENLVEVRRRDLAALQAKFDAALAQRDGIPREPPFDDALSLAIMFHHTYERLAPSKGYDTRTETRIFDPESPNGKLMVATCQAILDAAPTGIPREDARLRTEIGYILNAKRFDRTHFFHDTEFADWALSRLRAAMTSESGEQKSGEESDATCDPSKSTTGKED